MKILLQFLICILPVALSSQTSISMNSNNGKTKMTVSGDDINFSLEYEGEIILTDDDSDVESITEGGYFDLKKSAFGNRRRIFIENDGGQLVRKYYVGSKETPFDPEGRKWLAEVLLEVVRSSSLGAEKRVERLYKNGGANSVLDEVEEIDSDYVKSHYLNLLSKKNLSDSEVLSVLESISGVDSDHHRANVLADNLDNLTKSQSTMLAFIETTGKIDSDHHKANILKKAIKTGNIQDAKLIRLLEITDDIDSDHHKADILQDLLASKEMNAENVKLIVNMTRNIDSDHHKANILQSALGMSSLSAGSYNTFLEAISTIDSDHHKANILSNLINDDISADEIARICTIIRSEIDSDHHGANVLSQIISLKSLGESSSLVFEAITSIDSDHHQSNLLEQFSTKKLTEGQLIQFLQVSEELDSDHSLRQVLGAIASQVRSSTEKVKDGYRQRVMRLSSETSRNRLSELIK